MPLTLRFDLGPISVQYRSIFESKLKNLTSKLWAKMKTDNKIAIAAIRDALQEIEHYDDPYGKFKEAWEYWRDWCIRHHIHTPQYFRVKWKDGWLKKQEAAELCDFLIHDWHPKCLDI